MPVTHTHTTSEHVLAKFSSKSRRSDGSHADWMHWASPTLLITLAVSAASDGSVNAANLSVVWRRDGGDNGRGDITLEELDLLSFSQISPSPLQMRPLRAVYNGAIVGIRYMHPLIVPPSSQPTFNQLQVRFQDASDASQFVTALARFCPCKEEPSRPNNTNAMGPPPAKQIMLTRTPSTVSRPTHRHATPAFSPMHMSSSPAPIPSSSSSSQRPASHASRQTPTTAYDESQVELCFDSSSQLQDVTPSPRLPVPLQRTVMFDMPAPSAATPAELKRAISMLDSAAASFSNAPPSRSVPSIHTPAPIPTPVAGSSRPNPPAAIVPVAMPPASVSTVQTPPMLPPRAISDDAMQLADLTTPSRTSVVDPAPVNFAQTPDQRPASNTNTTPRDSVLASLREVPELYQLTTPQLERAVAEIVREPGFMEFLSRVEAMWHVRGLVGR
ncbi:hypothetical protein AURDEDRAFT_158279 [Auricularia subglabra TFB-10046 SS5]|nr:hypothetical protein AURDEDRAFT_158279 [Auricularia subglabra TFB-10046 SS5]